MVLFDGALFVLAFRIGVRHVREVQCLQGSQGGVEESECNTPGTQHPGQGTLHGLELRRRNKSSSRVNKGKGRTLMVKKIVGAEPASMVEIMLCDSILYYFVYVRSLYAFSFLLPPSSQWTLTGVQAHLNKCGQRTGMGHAEGASLPSPSLLAG